MAFAEDTGPPKPQPPIRSFDISTIERLGLAMYAQDQEAWKATDLLKARISKDQLVADKLHAWIVESIDGRDTVRFVHDTSSGPELYFDVTFANGAPASPAKPPVTTLTPAELAQYDARLLAIANIARPCTKTYNSVALPDPERNGWLVWALSATTDPDAIIVGGHYRVSISADGQTLTQADALSMACLTFNRRDLKNGSTAELVAEHLVSMEPTETYIFASLSYHLPLVVGTLNGRAWRVDGTQVTEVFDDSPDPEGVGVRALRGYEEHCKILMKTTDTPPKYVVGPTTAVIGPTENGDVVIPSLPSGNSATGIACSRVDIVPSPHDYKVLRKGLTLYVNDVGVGHPRRSAVLEIVTGRLQYRLVDGTPFDNDLQQRTNARLDKMQEALREDDKRGPSRR
jgi:hypothetical protein